MKDGILKTEERAVLALRALYLGMGYLPYKMSRFEDYDFYVRNKDFLESDRIITFSDPVGKLLALKPDVTLSIVKNAPEAPGKVEKLFYNEHVYRDYREILQTGLECVGDLGEYEIAEVVLLAVKSLEALGGSYVLDLSHMGLVAAVLESCGLGENQAALDCLMHKNTHDLRPLCREDSWEKLKVLASCRGRGADVFPKLEPLLTTSAEMQALQELKKLWKVLEKAGREDRVRLDFSVVNHLGYYSGLVFRGYLEGVPACVLSGGQYDALAKKLGKKSRAIGFAVYLDQLQDREDISADVDTLILHDGSVDTVTLAAAAEKAGRLGAVLVAREIPEGRSFRKQIRFERGERLP